MTKEEERRANAVKEALKLTPEERAVVIIKKDKKTFCLPFNVRDEAAVMEIFFNAVQGTIRNFLIKNNILDIDTQLLYLRDLFQSVENQYKEFYSKESEIEPDTSKH